jgi:CheY-like chemotaxis protein
MKTCLVVDDSSVIRKVARRILESLAFQITEAEDGRQALQHCERELPDAVLLDWNMPVMDGYEFLKAEHHLGPVAAGQAAQRLHEAVRQGNRRSQVPGSRSDLIPARVQCPE